jgi:putative ABC transport system permease protein
MTRSFRFLHWSAQEIEDLARDLKHSARGLWRSPGFSVAVVVTLALGIGGNAAIFSVVDQLLLRPLPYPNGEQLLTVHEVFQNAVGSDSSIGNAAISPANWLDWQRLSRTIQGFAAWLTYSVTLTDAGEPERLNAQAVSSEFFPLLGVSPLLGRAVSEADDRPKGPRVAVISYRLWQRRFGGDPNVIGRVVHLDDLPSEIIGVMPASFRFIYPDNDLWSPFQLNRNESWRETSGRFMNVVGRLQPNTPMGKARIEMEGIARGLAEKYTFNHHTSVVLVPLRQELTGQVQASIVILYVAVSVLLSIACFNVANLLLARAASRRREIAIRTSLGAGRWTIVRQLVVESLLLALIGGTFGVFLARWSLDGLVAFAPADLLRVPELFVDRRVLLYALGVSIATGVTAGLMPAVLVSRRSINASIRAGASTVTHLPRFRQVLVVCQVAMTVVLLCGAALLVRTVTALNHSNPGFDKAAVLTMEVKLPFTGYTPDRRRTFFREVVEALRVLPGVESAAAGNSLAVIGTPRGGTSFHRLGTAVLPPDERPTTIVRVVTAGYFRTLHIPVLRGREFAEKDAASPTQGFVVNEAFRKAYLSDIDPLDSSLSVWMQRPDNPYLRVIGVVGNVSEGSIRDDARPTVFYSHQQMPETQMTLFVRASSPTALVGSAVAAVHRLDPNLAVTKIQTFEDALSESIARERLNAFVSGGFALSGFLLASLGLYGLLAFLVAERTKEFGIRIAPGARVARLTGSVVGDGLRLTGIGATLGVAMSLLLFRFVDTLLFGVTAYDWPTYGAVLSVIFLMTILASYIPARRAARVEPLIALRQE